MINEHLSIANKNVTSYVLFECLNGFSPSQE